MVHGWNGRGAQLGAFVPALVRAGIKGTRDKGDGGIKV